MSRASPRRPSCSALRFRRWRVITECRCPSTPAAAYRRARTEAALRQIEAAGGVTTSVVSLVTAMAPDFAREPGRNAFAALQALRLA